MLVRQSLQLVVVDIPRIFADTVLHKMIELAGSVGRMPVCQVTAVVEVHGQHRIAGVEQRVIDGKVCLRAGVRLNVGVIGMEQRLGAFAGERFYDIHILASAVVTFAGVPFGVLVGQRAAHSGEHRGGNKVLRSDELQMVALAAKLQFHGACDFRVYLSYDWVRRRKFHFSLSYPFILITLRCYEQSYMIYSPLPDCASPARSAYTEGAGDVEYPIRLSARPRSFFFRQIRLPVQDGDNARAEGLFLTFLFIKPKDQVPDSAPCHSKEKRVEFRNPAAAPNAEKQKRQWQRVRQQACLHHALWFQADADMVANLRADGVEKLDFHFALPRRQTGAAVGALRAAQEANFSKRAVNFRHETYTAALLFQRFLTLPFRCRRYAVLRAACRPQSPALRSSGRKRSAPSGRR
ncbi:hypothetical protein SDC9_93432 [bioreactor metagenome]|uniref:Uncharacterized protein n=1 Tax=bioreactor metagenome TaxID=1076179 RepID=A0A645A1D6_9ZZZZ